MLVTVASFREPWEAYLFRFRLEAEGIGAVVAHQYHAGVNWPWSTALGGVKVQVLRDDAQGARAIAARSRTGEFRAELAAELGDLDDPHCPHCQSKTFDRRRTYPQLLMTLTLFLMLGVPVPPWHWLRHCRNCDNRWVE